MTYTLHAEQEVDVQLLPLTSFDTPEAAAAYVLQVEKDGGWPEGFDAVLTAPDGTRTYLDDQHPPQWLPC